MEAGAAVVLSIVCAHLGLVLCWCGYQWSGYRIRPHYYARFGREAVLLLGVLYCPAAGWMLGLGSMDRADIHLDGLNIYLVLMLFWNMYLGIAVSFYCAIRGFGLAALRASAIQAAVLALVCSLACMLLFAVALLCSLDMLIADASSIEFAIVQWQLLAMLIYLTACLVLLVVGANEGCGLCSGVASLAARWGLLVRHLACSFTTLLLLLLITVGALLCTFAPNHRQEYVFYTLLIANTLALLVGCVSVWWDARWYQRVVEEAATELCPECTPGRITAELQVEITSAHPLCPRLSWAALVLEEQPFAAGGQALIYRGTYDGKPVAVKEYFYDPSQPEAASEIVNELQAHYASQQSDAGIVVGLLGYCLVSNHALPQVPGAAGRQETGVQVLVVMELCERGSLLRVLHEEGTLTKQERLQLGAPPVGGTLTGQRSDRLHQGYQHCARTGASARGHQIAQLPLLQPKTRPARGAHCCAGRLWVLCRLVGC